jgi:hypothetical protein
MRHRRCESGRRIPGTASFRRRLSFIVRADTTLRELLAPQHRHGGRGPTPQSRPGSLLHRRKPVGIEHDSTPVAARSGEERAISATDRVGSLSPTEVQVRSWRFASEFACELFAWAPWAVARRLTRRKAGETDLPLPLPRRVRIPVAVSLSTQYWGRETREDVEPETEPRRRLFPAGRGIAPKCR